jgi:isopenicillin-N N-acyltransferase-like protein
MMEEIELSGSLRDMGNAFGEQCRDAIHELYDLRLANAVNDAMRFGGRTVDEEDLLELSLACYKKTEPFDPVGIEEQWGISEGADLSMAKTFAMGGLTDFRDVLSWGGPLETDGGCTAVIVSAEKSTDCALRLAQTWDLASNNMPYVVSVHRIPDEGPETWSVTTVGCLSLIGMNEHGLAIGTTNLRTLDSQVGVPYLNIIHRALRESNSFGAIGVVENAQRAGGHTYAIADYQSGAIVECTAERHTTREIIDGSVVQTNHCQVARNKEVEAEEPQPSSVNRFERMTTLLEENPSVSEEDLRKFLSDTEGGELAVSRHDYDGISTNAGIVITPSMRSISAVHGPPDQNVWRKLK